MGYLWSWSSLVSSSQHNVVLKSQKSKKLFGLAGRRHQGRRVEQQARDLEAAATIPEPKELFVVVHPGEAMTSIIHIKSQPLPIFRGF